MTTLFAICFLVGLGISAVSLFSSALHVHHGGAHFHGQGHGHGHGHSSLLKNSHDFFGSLFNLAAITMFLTCFGGIGLLLGRTTHLAALIVAVLAGGAGVAGAAMLLRILPAMRRRRRPRRPRRSGGGPPRGPRRPAHRRFRRCGGKASAQEPIQLVGTVGKLTIP